MYGSCFFTDTRYLLSCSEDTSGSYHFTISIFLVPFAVTEIMRAKTIVSGFPLGLENLEKWEGSF